MGMAETWGAWLVVGAVLALHVVYAFVYRVDSDEPQHLHVVWGWAHGLLQYRDIFDNHSPLFQMLCAPLFGALGEHTWIVVAMRLAMSRASPASCHGSAIKSLAPSPLRALLWGKRKP